MFLHNILFIPCVPTPNGTEPFARNMRAHAVCYYFNIAAAAAAAQMIVGIFCAIVAVLVVVVLLCTGLIIHN